MISHHMAVLIGVAGAVLIWLNSHNCIGAIQDFLSR
jgi:hypothetical protein